MGLAAASLFIYCSSPPCAPSSPLPPAHFVLAQSLEPTRHLWIGNLGTRTARAVLKTIFERWVC